LEKQEALLFGVVRDRLHLLKTVATLSEDPVDLVSQGLCDPVKVHVKNEPHRKSKLAEGRVRIICVVSQADELIDRLLFSLQDDAEIANFTECPSQPGFGLSNDESVNNLYQRVIGCHRIHAGCSNDQAGWDWHFSWELAKLDWALRCELNGASYNWDEPLKSDTIWARMAYIRYWCTFRSVFVTSNGVMLKQLVAAVMKSGSKITSSTNSRARGALSIILGSAWAFSMGDDCVEQWLTNMLDRYKQFGFEIKDIVPIEDDKFEFCSHEFINGKAIPKNWAKMFFRLLLEAPTQERVEQFKLEMRHSPELERCLGCLRGLWGESTNLIL